MAPLSTVASTGSYSDLSGKPTIPSSQVNSDWNAVSGVSQILNRPSLALVATSGAYSDLSGLPSIPSAQVNSDWNSASGVSQILNKPVLGTAAFQNSTVFDPAGSAASAQAFSIQRSNQTGTQLAATISDFSSAALSAVTWSTLTGKPSFATVATSGAYSDLSGLPTLGTASAQPTSSFATSAQGTLADTAVQPAALTSGLATKFNNPSGSTAQYLRGDGSTATFPTAVSSFTNDSGYLTGITSGQVTTALGFTPYNATNPSGFITQSGARTAISLTTTGSSGAATYNSSTGVLNVPSYSFSLPNVGTPGTYVSVTTDSQGRVTSGNALSINNSPGRSLVTVAAAANGWQVSSTRNAEVRYSVTIVSTASLSGAQSGYVVLEICPTNSSTAGDWVEIARVSNGQSVALAIALTAVATGGGQINGTVPAGYYVRQRSVNVSGTPTFSTNGQQEILY
jgi:hypothetical protein